MWQASGFQTVMTSDDVKSGALHDVKYLWHYDCRTGEMSFGSDELRRRYEVGRIYQRPADAIARFLTNLHLHIFGK